MKLLTVLCVCLSVWAAGADPLPSECQWGASFWCRSKEAARRCGRVEYCQTNVWKTTSSKTSLTASSTSCEVCEVVTTIVRTLMTSQKVEAEAKTLVNDVCTKLPGEAGQVCSEVVENYFDEIWKAIENNVDPSTICSEIGLCSSSLSTVKAVKGDDSVLCDVCKLVEKFLKPYVDSSATEGEVKNALQSLCKLLPGTYSQQCSILESAYFNVIWGILKTQVDTGDMCVTIRVCNSTTSSRLSRPKDPVVPVLAKTKESTDLCEICKTVLNYIKPYVDSNNSKEMVQSMLDGFCAMLNSSECKSIIDDNFDMIWSLLQTEVDTNAICLCNSTKTAKLPITPVLVKSPVAADGCDICKLVVSYVKPFVDSKSTEDEIQAALEQFCKILPANASEECEKYVGGSGFELIWTLLKAEVDSGDICKQINLCNATKTSLYAALRLAKAGLAKTRVSIDGCQICQMVTSIIQPFVDNKVIETDAEKAVELICKILPGNLSVECVKIVDNFFSLIWELVQSEVDGGTICRQIGLCGSTKTSYTRTSRLNALPPKLALAKTPVSADACDICKAVVGYIKPFVDSQATEDEIKQAVEQVCVLINVTGCKTIVDGYFDVIWKMLQTEVDSGDICKQLGLCSTTITSRPRIARPNKLLAKPSLAKLPVADGECDMCKEVVGFLRVYVDNNKTEAEVKSDLVEACSLIPSISSACQSIVNTYFDMLWKFVQAEMDTDAICANLGLCNSSSSRHTKVAFKTRLSSRVNSVKADVPCDICKLIVQELDIRLANNNTEAEAKEEIEKFCSLLGSFESECKDLIDQYFDAIWQLLIQTLRPADVCTRLGLCTSSKAARPHVSKTQNSEECTVCKLIVTFLDKELASNSTESEAKAAFLLVCDDLGGLSGTCRELVNQYFDDIWQALVNNLDPNTVCTTLGLCSSTKAALPSVSKTQSSVECTVCKLVVGFLDKELSSQKTEAEAEAAVLQVCSDLGPLASVCKDLVNQYFDQIWEALINGLAPEKVCEQLGLCSSTKTALLGSKRVNLPKFVCSGCKDVVGLLIDGLLGDSMESKVEKQLEGICSKLPSATDTAECKSLLDGLIPVVWNFLKSKTNKDMLEQKACELIHLCKSTSKVSTPSIKSPKGFIECEVCKLVAEGLDKLLDSNSTDQEIKAGLEKVCSLPLINKYKDTCESFIDEYSDTIIKLVVSGGLKELCSLVGLCSSANLQMATANAVAVPKEPTNTVTCEACEEVLELLKNFLGSNEAEAESFLLDVCDLFPASVKPECTNFVKSYGPDVIEIIADAIDPKTECQSFCTTRKHFKWISLRVGNHQL